MLLLMPTTNHPVQTVTTPGNYDNRMFFAVTVLFGDILRLRDRPSIVAHSHTAVTQNFQHRHDAYFYSYNGQNVALIELFPLDYFHGVYPAVQTGDIPSIMNLAPACLVKTDYDYLDWFQMPNYRE